MELGRLASEAEHGHYKLENEVHDGAREDVAVKAIQEATVAGNEVTSVLQAGVPLHDRLYEVAKEAGKEYNRPQGCSDLQHRHSLRLSQSSRQN